MPFHAPSAARLPPLSFLLNDQTEPQKKVARHLGREPPNAAALQGPRQRPTRRVSGALV